MGSPRYVVTPRHALVRARLRLSSKPGQLNNRATSHKPKGRDFRAHEEGLRAVAVTTVVLYYADFFPTLVSWLS